MKKKIQTPVVVVYRRIIDIYANQHHFNINEWMEKLYSRKSRKEKLIDLLLEYLETRDRLIVVEISSLG